MGNDSADHGEVLGEVLCVDDDKVQRILYKRMVTKAGWLCTLAGSAEEALDILVERWSATGDDSTFPQQAIIGLCLPGMSGVEALAEIRGRFPDAVLPVALCSSAHAELLSYTEHHDDAFALFKPFLPTHLRACLDSQAKLGRLKLQHRELARKAAVEQEGDPETSKVVRVSGPQLHVLFRKLRLPRYRAALGAAVALLLFLHVVDIAVCLAAPCSFYDIGSPEALAAGRCVDEYKLVSRVRMGGYIVCFAAAVALMIHKFRAVTACCCSGGARASRIDWTWAASPDLYEESLNSIRAASVVVGLTICPFTLLSTAAFLAPAVATYSASGSDDALFDAVCGGSQLCLLGKHFNYVLAVAAFHNYGMAAVRYLSLPNQMWSIAMGTAMDKKHNLRRVRLHREPYLLLASLGILFYTNLHRVLRDVPNIAHAAEVAALFLVQFASLVFSLSVVWNSLILQDTYMFLRGLARMQGVPAPGRLLRDRRGQDYASAEPQAGRMPTVLKILDQSTTGQRQEVLLLSFALVMYLRVTTGVTIFQAVVVYTMRAVLACLILLLREREANFEQLRNSPGFGLVVCASTLRRSLLCALKGGPFEGRLPLYKGTAVRMQDTLAISYRWQEEEIQISSDCALNMGRFQLEALAAAIQEHRCRYVWLDCLSVPQHNCDLKYSLLARMMAVYAAAPVTVALRSIEAPGSRYHQRAWTCQEYCTARSLHVVTQITRNDDDDVEAAMLAVKEVEEAEVEALRQEIQMGAANTVPLWLRDTPFTAEEAKAVVAKHRALSSRLHCNVHADKIRALLPLLTRTPCEGQGELVALVHQLGQASGEDLRVWKGELLEQHVTIKHNLWRSSVMNELTTSGGSDGRIASKRLSERIHTSNPTPTRSDALIDMKSKAILVRRATMCSPCASPSNSHDGTRPPRPLQRSLSARPAREMQLDMSSIKQTPKKNTTFTSVAAANIAAKFRKAQQRSSLFPQSRPERRGSPLGNPVRAIEESPPPVPMYQELAEVPSIQEISDSEPLVLPGQVTAMPYLGADSARKGSGDYTHSDSL